MTPSRAVFLDRDGVLIRTYVQAGVPYPPYNLSEMEILPGVAEAVDRLRVLGLLRIVVTNQPDVARDADPRSRGVHEPRPGRKAVTRRRVHLLP